VSTDPEDAVPVEDVDPLDVEDPFESPTKIKMSLFEIH